MISFFKKVIFGILIAGLFLRVPAVQAASLIEAPTGLVELDEFHEPVSLYVPDSFKKAKQHVMLIVIPAHQTANETAAAWQTLADSKNILVVSPFLVVRDEDVPYKTDEWLVKLKKTLAQRYNVQQVYLAGFGASADYAAYLGLKKPEEFDGVASVGGSWTGPFEKLTKLSVDAAKQRPFFVALDEKDERVAKTQGKIKEMTAKGYSVRLVMLNQKGEEDADKFRSDMLYWLEAQAEKDAALHIAGKAKKKTFKQKVSQVIDDLVAV